MNSNLLKVAMCLMLVGGAVNIQTVESMNSKSNNLNSMNSESNNLNSMNSNTSGAKLSKPGVNVITFNEASFPSNINLDIENPNKSSSKPQVNKPQITSKINSKKGSLKSFSKKVDQKQMASNAFNKFKDNVKRIKGKMRNLYRGYALSEDEIATFKQVLGLQAAPVDYGTMQDMYNRTLNVMMQAEQLASQKGKLIDNPDLQNEILDVNEKLSQLLGKGSKLQTFVNNELKKNIEYFISKKDSLDQEKQMVSDKIEAIQADIQKLNSALNQQRDKIAQIDEVYNENYKPFELYTKMDNVENGNVDLKTCGYAIGYQFMYNYIKGQYKFNISKYAELVRNIHVADIRKQQKDMEKEIHNITSLSKQAQDKLETVSEVGDGVDYQEVEMDGGYEDTMIDEAKNEEEYEQQGDNEEQNNYHVNNSLDKINIEEYNNKEQEQEDEKQSKKSNEEEDDKQSQKSNEENEEPGNDVEEKDSTFK